MYIGLITHDDVVPDGRLEEIYPLNDHPLIMVEPLGFVPSTLTSITVF